MSYCPTYLIIANYFTKPLQGRLFHLFRDIIMGYAPLSDLVELIPDKERVGNRNMSKNTSVESMSEKSSVEIREQKLTALVERVERSKKVTWGNDKIAAD